MKTTRRVLSLVLALMMFLSLSVTAFATEATPRVEGTIYNEDGTVTTFELAANVGQSMYDVIGETNAEWETVDDWNDPEVTHEAMISYRGKSSTPFDSSKAVDKTRLEAAIEDPVNQITTTIDLDKVTWYTGTRQGYGLVSEVNGVYTYIYGGYDWTYSSNYNTRIYDYMCCYNLSAGEVVQLVYGMTVAVWTTTTPIA